VIVCGCGVIWRETWPVGMRRHPFDGKIHAGRPVCGDLPPNGPPLVCMYRHIDADTRKFPGEPLGPRLTAPAPGSVPAWEGVMRGPIRVKVICTIY